MADWLGDYPEDFTTVTCMFITNQASGAPVVPSSAFEAADVLIYKNGNATQKTTTNGVTMTSPFNGVTGAHCVTIDTSNDTGDGGFWVAGAVYTIILSPDETVDGVTVASVIGQFGIDLSSTLRPTTVGRKLDVSAAGEAGLDWANIGSPTTAVNLSGTNIDVDQVVASVSGAVGSVTGAVGSVGTGGITAASIATGAIDADALAADAGNEIAVAVWASSTRALTILDEDTTTLDLDATIRAAVGLASANLDTQLNALPTAAENADAVWDEALSGHTTADTFGDVVNDLTEDDAGVYRFTTNALELAPTGGSAPSAATIADAVWDEAIAGHLTAGSTGEALDGAGGGASPSAIADEVQTRTIAAVTMVNSLAANTVTASALATDAVTEIQNGLATAAALANLQTSVTTIDDLLDTEIPALTTAVADLPTNAELATALGTSDDATLAAIAALDSDVDAVATRVTDVWQIHGLDIGNPMTVTPTSRDVATIEQTIGGDGQTISTVTRTA